MKFAALFVSLCTLATGIASAASSYNVTLRAHTVVAGKELKQGSYRVHMDGNNATIKGEGGSVQTTVTPTQNETKFTSTNVQYHLIDGKFDLDEIRLGGTSTRLVFTGNRNASGN